MRAIQKPYHFYVMRQGGGTLRDAVNSMEEISEEEFKKLSPNYKYYCYDERIECLRFIYKAQFKYSYGGEIINFYILISQCSLATIKELTRRFLKRQE